jgi:hypothetical protein
MDYIPKIEHNNRTYIYDASKRDEEKFQIFHDKEIPDYLTKYYTVSDHNIDAVTNNYLYAAHPLELNDPFDCYKYLIDKSKIKDQHYKELVSRMFPNTGFDFEGISLGNKFIDLFHHGVFRNCGIISLTNSKNENPSLWANYTNKHQGFSVTYNRKAINANGPFPIDYLTKLESKFEPENFQALLPYLTCIKSEYWRNEEEWRYLYFSDDEMYVPDIYSDKENKLRTKNNRHLPLIEKGAIYELTLGIKFFSDPVVPKNANNEWIFDLNNDTNRPDLKVKLLNYMHENKIPLRILYEDRHNIKFVSIRANYKFFKDTKILLIKDPGESLKE